MSNGRDIDGDGEMGKRVGKQRVVMVDGRGTGYGGAVPVLAETMVTPLTLFFNIMYSLHTHVRICSTHAWQTLLMHPIPPLSQPTIYLLPTFSTVSSTHSSINPPSSSSSQEKAKATSTSVVRHKSRSWTHMNFCAFCAKSKFTDQNTLTKCAHCPRVFHADCLENHGLTRGTGMFICPHHKCASCSRSTASAGETSSLWFI